MFGHTVREAIGANVSMLMPEPHGRKHDTYIASYLRTGQAMALAKREGHELALLYIDLGRFKAVNDSLGHDAGMYEAKQARNAFRFYQP